MNLCTQPVAADAREPALGLLREYRKDGPGRYCRWQTGSDDLQELDLASGQSSAASPSNHNRAQAPSRGILKPSWQAPPCSVFNDTGPETPHDLSTTVGDVQVTSFASFLPVSRLSAPNSKAQGSHPLQSSPQRACRSSKNVIPSA